MYVTRKTYIKQDTKLADVFFENPYLLIIMEHFGYDYVIGKDKKIAEVARDNNVSTQLFLDILNLYNGFIELKHQFYTRDDASRLIFFLKNAHQYYIQEKYPEVKQGIESLYNKNRTNELKLVYVFFESYFKEVLEHLEYEDKVAFPYFLQVLHADDQALKNYSVKTYCNHHSDIETKIAELKRLLIKHIPITNDNTIRRKLIISLFELEYDLKIHSVLEEKVLIPIITSYEKTKLLF